MFVSDMMSKKCKYAIKALIELAKKHEQAYLSTKEIADAQNIPKKFLEQILNDLKLAGYINSKAGYGGGHYLRMNPSEITVADVFRLFDGAIALVPCVAHTRYEKCDDCLDEDTCTIKREFAIIREQTRMVMKHTTIQSFLD